MTDANRQQIENNKHRREKFLDELEKDPSLFSDPKLSTLYLKGLSDSDKQAQTNLRLEVEDKAADSAAEQAQAISAISESIASSASNPFRKVTEGVKLERPVVKNTGEFEILETELSTTSTSQSHEQFTQRRKEEEQERLKKKPK